MKNEHSRGGTGQVRIKRGETSPHDLGKDPRSGESDENAVVHTRGITRGVPLGKMEKRVKNHHEKGRANRGQAKINDNQWRERMRERDIE